MTSITAKILLDRLALIEIDVTTSGQDPGLSRASQQALAQSLRDVVDVLRATINLLDQGQAFDQQPK